MPNHNLRVNLAFLAMIFIVVISNYLVLFPINNWLTWGALPYPVSFLVTELTNRSFGPKKARQVVYAGFFFAVMLSYFLSTPNIALASGSAFLVSQLLDIFVFNQFRQSVWWYGPLFASASASIIDSIIFWSIAFIGEDIPLLTMALGDFSVKLLIDVAMLTPFRLAMRRIPMPA